MFAPRLLIGGLLGYFAMAVLPARADVSLVFAFTSDHCTNPLTGSTGGCTTGAANMGTIIVSQTDTQAALPIPQVSVHVDLLPGFGFVASGAGGGSKPTGSPSFFFRLLNDPTITFSGLTTGWFVPGGGPSLSAGTYAGDGLAGQFEYALQCYPDAAGCSWGGSSPKAPPLDFTVTASGLTPAAFNDTGNASGSPFAADVLSSTGNTGLIDASVSSVPEPTSIALFGGVLLFVARALRKRYA